MSAPSTEPRHGQTWIRKRKGITQETRHVTDRNLGGDVYYVPGRWSRHRSKYAEKCCTLQEWNEWAVQARNIT